MPIFEAEVIHRIVYKRTIEAPTQEAAEEIAKELWMDIQKQYIADEYHEVMVNAVEEGAKGKS